jgi:two-component system nitrogen regulation sensor histidine kinase NtrY
MSESRLALAPVLLNKRSRRSTSRLGPFAVVLALAVALTSFVIFAGYTPITPTSNVIGWLFAVNGLCILLLAGLVVTEAWSLIVALRTQVAGARLHIRIVSLFSIIAVVPAILMAIVGSVTLERSLNPEFMRDVPQFISEATGVAGQFRQAQCKSLLQEAQLTATDLNRARMMFEADRQLFHEYFASRARFLGFTAAAMMRLDGSIVDKIDTGADKGAAVVYPKVSDFDDARKGDLSCLILDEGSTFVALRQIPSFNNAYLYVARPVDSLSVDFARKAWRLVSIYSGIESHRQTIQLAFALMYVFIALIMLFSATWLGLSFANQLVAPIRRLIAATDQVSSGNLYVQVPVHRSEGDLAHLGETFNKMTSELRLQQNRLIAASNLIDERRLFTEAVLSGVPVAVIGIGLKGQVTVLNPSAEKLISASADATSNPVGRPIEDVFAEVVPVLAEARGGLLRLVQSQIAVNRGGRDRIFNVRVTSEPGARADKNYVVTLDDITDLVTAQRTAAWADVARRIAHEIKNPLTPIQLSAERLKRKYGKVIQEGREVFDQCTDTIIRQVDDIKRMVDEFSSFARMPKARLESDDLSDCVRRILFLMRVGHPDIEFEEHLPEEPLMAHFDRRLLSQALTNIIKNATEGIAAKAASEAVQGRIKVSLSVTPEGVAEIFVTDNGKGFPKENRNRLLEPYMTTRAEGTGLGLPIVTKILEDHGGGLDLLDAPDGEGACVRLYFLCSEKSRELRVQS